MGDFARRTRGLSDAAGNGTGAVLPGAFSTSHPALWEYLTLTRWEDGTPRQTASFTVFLDGCVLRACVNDKDGGRVAFASSETWEGLFEALEGLLADDAADWRRNRESGGGKARRGG